VQDAWRRYFYRYRRASMERPFLQWTRAWTTHTGDKVIFCGIPSPFPVRVGTVSPPCQGEVPHGRSQPILKQSFKLSQCNYSKNRRDFVCRSHLKCVFEIFLCVVQDFLPPRIQRRTYASSTVGRDRLEGWLLKTALYSSF
jgi:hypothetical protein